MSVWQYYSFNGILRKKILSFCTHSSELGIVFLIKVNNIHLTLASNRQAQVWAATGYKPTIIFESSDHVNLLKPFLFYCPHTP